MKRLKEKDIIVVFKHREVPIQARILEIDKYDHQWDYLAFTKKGNRFWINDIEADLDYKRMLYYILSAFE